MSEIIEKEFKILMIDKKNNNHRAYPLSVVNKWIEQEKNIEENLGFDLEYAIDNEEEEIFRDIYNEFILESLNCGVVKNLRIDEENFLYATVKIKPPKFCENLTEEIYSNKLNIEDYAIVPKGKGSVKNQEVQDDYELYGFNLILKKDSSFEYEEKK